MRPQTSTQLNRLLVGFFFQTIPGTMVAPMLALSLAARGVDAVVIGALATLASVAYMAALPVAPALMRRLGEQVVFRAAMLIGAAALAGLILSDSPPLWAALYALLGFVAGLRFTLAESWTPALAPPEARGRAMALLQTSVGAAAFAGSGALLILGVDGAAPRVVILTSALVAVVVLWPVRAPQSAPAVAAPQRGGLVGALALAGPIVLAAAALGGMFESGLWVALPLYGLAAGASRELATAIITAMGVGSLAQYPFGALADRYPWRRVVIGTAALLALSAMLLPLAADAPLALIALGFIWGSAGGGLYTLAIIRNGSALRGAQLIRASVVTQFAYMLGEAGGPTAGGLAIDVAPRYGLPALIIALALTGLATLVICARERRTSQHQPVAEPSPNAA